MVLDRLNADRRGDVGFPGSWAADEDEIVGIVREFTSVKLTGQGLVDLARGKIEAGQVLVGREARGLDLIGDGAHFAFGGLRLQQLSKDRHGVLEGRRALFDEFGDRLGHAIHLQAA